MRRKLLFTISLLLTIHVVGSWVLAAGRAVWSAKAAETSVSAMVVRSVPTAPVFPRYYPLMAHRLIHALQSPTPEDAILPSGRIIIVTWVVWLLAVVTICFVGLWLYRGSPLRSKKRGFEALSPSEPPSPKTT